MKKNISSGLLLAALFCFPLFSYSQGLTVSTPQLNFGVASELAADSLQLTITNTETRDVTVTGIKFYNTYSTPAFYTGNNFFVIAAGSFVNIWVKFLPRHNIAHTSEMVIENDGLRGFVSVELTGQGHYSNSYYNATENLKEEALKTQITATVSSPYFSLGYNVARDSMFMSIDNFRTNGRGASQNTLECVYTGRLAVGYTDRADCQTNYDFNTEHTLPQSLFSSAEPMKSDLHHLFPTDNTANNVRADNPFAVVTNPTWSNGGSLSDGTHFEPRDAHKGETARALLYFILRYQNYSNFVDAAQENFLRTWHNNFLPTAVEIKRNNDIQAVQLNRNPFVDYPQFAERIHSFITTSVEPSLFSYDLTQDTIIYGFVPANTGADFNYVLVNNGNESIDVSNVQVTHPAELSVISGGGNSTLQPGEALNIDLHFLSQTTDSVRAFLSFHLAQTGGASQADAVIPVFVNDLQFDAVAEIPKSMLNVYPNPAHDRLNISASNSGIIQLTGADGKIILSSPVLKSENLSIDISSIAKGMYTLRMISAENVSVKKIIVD